MRESYCGTRRTTDLRASACGAWGDDRRTANCTGVGLGGRRSEAKTHLTNGAKTTLEEFPGGYCYFASQWEGREPEAPIAVLEKYHRPVGSRSVIGSGC